MPADEGLWQLADEAGIEPRYWDIVGNLHETTPDTARALLEALGLPARSEREIAASLAVLVEEKWQSPLPPVVIAREHDEIVMPLRLPLNGGARTIRWSVQLEGGENRAADCDLAVLPIEETGHSRGSPIGLRRLKLAPLPAGYHEFRLAGEEMTLLIIAPARCFLPAGERHWGITTQLYSLNSLTNWGIGDFGDLRTLVERTAAGGACAIGLNPLHALFLDAPEQASPYSPSSRLFRNPLYLDVTAIPDLAESAEARAQMQMPEIGRAIAAARGSAFVDYKAVAECKLAVLQSLHRSFEAKHVWQGTARGQAFRSFAERGGQALQRFATFQMLSEHFGGHAWSRWPVECRDCDSDAVSDLRHRHIGRISFFTYLQWMCEQQLSQAAEMARQRGMAVGLCNDLAVSVDAASADHWAHRNSFAAQLRVGAPPDSFNERGQEWGILPLNPRQLRATRYSHFIALLRANMRHAGALRIDHVMGWQRLFLMLAGAPPTSGAYVRFPLDELLAITALESQRNRCLVIGEDLGTVLAGFRERMAEANVLSCRVFYFERERELFRRPHEYPALAAVSAATHDLPTLRGFWNADDINVKAGLGTLKPAEEEARARATRTGEKYLLLQALASESLLPDGLSPSDADHLDWTPDLTGAVHLYLARTPGILLLVQLDDLADEVQQANLPGSTTEYPNWRRRLSRRLGDLLGDPAIQEQMAAITSARTK